MAQSAAQALRVAKIHDLSRNVFGDLFLEDRAYVEKVYKLVQIVVKVVSAIELDFVDVVPLGTVDGEGEVTTSRPLHLRVDPDPSHIHGQLALQSLFRL